MIESCCGVAGWSCTVGTQPSHFCNRAACVDVAIYVAIGQECSIGTDVHYGWQVPAVTVWVTVCLGLPHLIGPNKECFACFLQLVDEAYQRWLAEEDGVVDDITAVVVRFVHNSTA